MTSCDLINLVGCCCAGAGGCEGVDVVMQMQLDGGVGGDGCGGSVSWIGLSMCAKTSCCWWLWWRGLSHE